jgi:hypothetical protein
VRAVFDENSQSSLGSLSLSVNKKRKNWGDVGHQELAGKLFSYLSNLFQAVYAYECMALLLYGIKK